MKKILVIGSTGQIGSELVPELQRIYGYENVIPSGIKEPSPNEQEDQKLFVYLDVLQKSTLQLIINKYNIDVIYHLASILSANGEKHPLDAWNLNINGLLNVLEVARVSQVDRVIWPSSIAAFGPTSPRISTPDDTILQPTTIYGISKVTGELLMEYYHAKYGLDCRSVRLPGIISSKTLPGGGTTDYAVEIFYEAINKNEYTCFLQKNTLLPMLYMPDCIHGLITLMETSKKKLTRTVYNIAGMSFSPQQLADAIRSILPAFKIDFLPDFRQQIADSWPESLDDSNAKLDWGWAPKFSLNMIVKDMLEKIAKKMEKRSN